MVERGRARYTLHQRIKVRCHNRRREYTYLLVDTGHHWRHTLESPRNRCPFGTDHYSLPTIHKPGRRHNRHCLDIVQARHIRRFAGRLGFQGSPSVDRCLRSDSFGHYKCDQHHNPEDPHSRGVQGSVPHHRRLGYLGNPHYQRMRVHQHSGPILLDNST